MKLNRGMFRAVFGGKVVIVTGAADGVGSELVEQLVASGAKVLAIDVNEAGLEALSRRMYRLYPDKIKTLVLDLSSAEDVQMTLLDFPRDFQMPDFLFNVAGVTGLEWIGEQLVGTSRFIMEVNFFAPIIFIEHFVCKMQERGSGWIVTIASGSAELVNPGGAIYCASKAAIYAFMKVLRMELTGTGVGTSVVLLGTVDTDLHRKGVLGNKVFGRIAEGLLPMSPADAARKILQGVARGERKIAFSAPIVLGLLANRLFPRPLDFIMDWGVTLRLNLQEKRVTPKDLASRVMKGRNIPIVTSALIAMFAKMAEIPKD